MQPQPSRRPDNSTPPPDLDTRDYVLTFPAVVLSPADKLAWQYLWELSEGGRKLVLVTPAMIGQAQGSGDGGRDRLKSLRDVKGLVIQHPHAVSGVYKLQVLAGQAVVGALEHLRPVTAPDPRQKKLAGFEGTETPALKLADVGEVLGEVLGEVPAEDVGGEGGEFLDCALAAQENTSPPSSSLQTQTGEVLGEVPGQVPSPGGAKDGVRAPAARTRPAPAADQERSWSRARRALRAAGLSYANAAVTQARQQGLTPEETERLAEFYSAHRGAWNSDLEYEPGVIFLAIREWVPGSDPDDWKSWPPRRREYRKAQSAAADRQSDRARADAEAAQREHEARELAALEAAWGPTLDLLDSEALDQLRQAAGLDARFLKKFGIAKGSTVRLALLKQLARKPKPR